MFEVSHVVKLDGTSKVTNQHVDQATTLFFGLNALRFDIVKDQATLATSISGISLVAQDKHDSSREVVSKLEVSQSYNAHSIALKLTLVSGDVVYIKKTIDATNDQSRVEFIRVATDGTYKSVENSLSTAKTVSKAAPVEVKVYKLSAEQLKAFDKQNV